LSATIPDGEYEDVLLRLSRGQSHHHPQPKDRDTSIISSMSDVARIMTSKAVPLHHSRPQDGYGPDMSSATTQPKDLMLIEPRVYEELCARREALRRAVLGGNENIASEDDEDDGMAHGCGALKYLKRTTTESDASQDDDGGNILQDDNRRKYSEFYKCAKRKSNEQEDEDEDDATSHDDDDDDYDDGVAGGKKYREFYNRVRRMRGKSQRTSRRKCTAWLDY
jgi:hypothetical protein